MNLSVGVKDPSSGTKVLGPASMDQGVVVKISSLALIDLGGHVHVGPSLDEPRT